MLDASNPRLGHFAPEMRATMNKMQFVLVSAALAFGIAGPASAGVNDPEVIIYRFPGVASQGTTGTGGATAFHCTNFSGVTENVRIVVRLSDGSLSSNTLVAVSHLHTVVMPTRPVSAYFPVTQLGFPPVPIFGGTAAIAATSINIICTAMVIDGAATVPDGVALRGVRFNPVPGSQE